MNNALHSAICVFPLKSEPRNCQNKKPVPNGTKIRALLDKAKCGDESRRDCQKLAGDKARPDPSGLAEPPVCARRTFAPAGAPELLRSLSLAPTGADSHGCAEPVVLARSSLHHRLISGSHFGTNLRQRGAYLSAIQACPKWH